MVRQGHYAGGTLELREWWGAAWQWDVLRVLFLAQQIGQRYGAIAKIAAGPQNMQFEEHLVMGKVATHRILNLAQF